MRTIPPIPPPGAATPLGASGAPARAAWQAAQEFEAVFLGQMLHAMMPEATPEGSFGGGPAEGTYRGMMNEQLGRAIARSGGIGVAPAVFREILRQQELKAT